MPRYLSAEWLEAAQLALAADDVLAKVAAEVELSVQQQVTGGADGDVAFHVDIDHGAVNLVSGEAENPTVTFIQSYETAAAIGRGELSAQGAFMTGLIRVRGDLPKLVEHGDVFGGVDDVLAELRTHTTY